MKEIPLTQGKVALVDDADYDQLASYKWYALKGRNTFYAVRSVRDPTSKASAIAMHRQILCLAFGDPRESDHINHNGLDNRRSNLRIVTKEQNQWNERRNALGYYPKKGRKKFEACISVKGKNVCLGYFDNAEDAHAAYLRAKNVLHQIPGGVTDLFPSAPAGSHFGDRT